MWPRVWLREIGVWPAGQSACAYMRYIYAAETVVSRDHATALRRNNAELKCTKSIQNSQTFSTVLHRGNLGFSTDFCTEIEVYMSSL